MVTSFILSYLSFIVCLGLTYRLDLSSPLAIGERRGKAYFLNMIQAKPTRIPPRISPCAKYIAPFIATPPFLSYRSSAHSSPASVPHSQEWRNDRRRSQRGNRWRSRSFCAFRISVNIHRVGIGNALPPPADCLRYLMVTTFANPALEVW